ncbi:MAG TPA: TatD family hydrolase [Syntrophales bacterium]|nr:TatD family hydrolase [Syntrophales bacterium]
MQGKGLILADSHAHLEMRDFDRDRDEVVKRAEDAGVALIVTVGTTLDDCRKAVSIAGKYEGIYAAVGIHPHDVKDIGNGTYDSLKKLAKMDKVVAFGEIGLDFFRNLSPRETQIMRFEEQLEVAAEIGLPVIIHDREAHKETVSILVARKPKHGGVIHCFSGDKRMASQCLDMGFYISIPGAITFGKPEKLGDVVRHIPLERLLVETDAPYITPVPNRGKRNEPAYVVHTARKVAEIKSVPFEELARATYQNTKDVFGIA